MLHMTGGPSTLTPTWLAPPVMFQPEASACCTRPACMASSTDAIGAMDVICNALVYELWMTHDINEEGRRDVQDNEKRIAN